MTKRPIIKAAYPARLSPPLGGYVAESLPAIPYAQPIRVDCRPVSRPAAGLGVLAVQRYRQTLLATRALCPQLDILA